mmetsp:Transcript_77509/g.187737  ORF Transcript_77509/g.187737 Transcript_77509/m.187737 type:complete len:1226 (+) Transcript_77509:67-3744(+)
MEGSLEYKIVEIFNQPALPPPPDALAKDPQADPIDVDGKKGQVVAWVEEQNKYIVETFDGDLVAIPEEHLKAYEPPPVAEGGFDLAFPLSEGRADDFQSDIATALTENKYCVVQMSLGQVDKKAIGRQIQELDHWARFMPEFEDVYMGQRPDGKRVQWYVNDNTAYEGDIELENVPGLETVDQHLSNLATCVCNISPYLGFQGVCRSNGMLHMNCANSEEELNLLDAARGNAVGAGIIQGHLAFFHRRKVCIIYFVNGSGGTLTLHPADIEADDITISCQEGQAVVFRHDLMSYTYLPEGRQLALQAWIFREQQAGECSMTQPDLMSYKDAIEAIPRGPAYGNNGKSTDIFSFGVRLPGMVNQSEHFWTGLASGYDGVIRIPLTRWDHDFYFHPEPEVSVQIGRAYTQHEGMLDNDTQMLCFDNEFFGIDPEDAQLIDPLARCCLEVGYDCLYRAGWTKPKLLGTSMVIVNGIANNEFEAGQMRQCFNPISAKTRDNLNLGATAARLHHCMGMQGKVATIETACSSSLTAVALVHTHMRPDQAGQMKMGSSTKQEQYGMAMGANGHFDPFFMVGLCGAKMLSIQGRCFTFDQSGDGFLRSEGEAAMYFKNSEGEDLARLAMVCGTCMNQDGRSASLTAPHGPSQQECIRHSLREAQIPPLLIQMQELHGTGTALGDPIEVGALRATMMQHQGEVREHPLVKTSSKSNIGHTELCAGLAGIIKCTLMGIYCAACPNNHIRLLNPHIDSNSYPVYFLPEFCDQGKNEGYVGVSSFGFGGSNARGDIWARSLCGPRNTDPGTPKCQLTRERVYVWNEVLKQSCPRMHVEPQMENALENFEDYDDAYMAGEQPSEDDSLYCIGSFNGWSTPEKMTFVEETSSYIFSMPLGETCVEQFQIMMNKNEFFKIFPASKMADQDAFVLGPGMAPKGNHWVIDGRKQRLPQGTIYHITLQWDMETRKKTVTWEPSVDDYMVSLASELPPFTHRYHVIGSWTTWKPLEMQPARGDKPGTFETHVKVGVMRHEEFRFQRDRDKMQSIYPARQQATETSDDAQSVPVCGPDHLGEGKYWTVSGKMGEDFKITLTVWDGEITVTTASTRLGILTWTNDQVLLRRKYFVSATWNDWGFSQMEPDPDAEEGYNIHLIKVPMNEDRWVAFQIVVDEDKTQTIHPDMPLTDQRLSPAMGPDAKGEDHFWGLYVERGQFIEITLDLDAEDRREVVTWEITGRGR